MAGTGAVKAGEAYVLLTLRNQLSRGIKTAQRQLDSMASGFRSAGNTMRSAGIGMVGAAAAIGAPLGLSAKTFADFQDQVSATGAVSGATRQELTALADQAKMLGRTTSFTASQIASLQTELGRMGFSPTEILAATPAIQDLGRATRTELAEAATIAGAAIRQFNLDASDTTRVADVLTAAANSSAQSLTDIGESMSYVGPVAADAGLSIEETAKIVGLLANMGLKGSMAGTGLRRILLSLADPNVRKTIEDLTKSKVDVGNPAATLQELGKALVDMPAEERLDLMRQLFDLRGMTGALKIATTPEQFDRISKAIDNAAGAANRTATAMDDNLGGAFRRIASAAEGVRIAIGESLDNAFRKYEGIVTDALNAITEFIEANQWLGPAAAGVAAGLGAIGTALLIGAPLMFMMANGLSMISSVLGVAGLGVSALFAIPSAIAAIVSALPFLAGIGIGYLIVELFDAVGLFDEAKASAASLSDYIGGQFVQSWEGLKESALSAFDVITGALQRGDTIGAVDGLMAGMQQAFASGMAPIAEMWEKFWFQIREGVRSERKGLIEAQMHAMEMTGARLYPGGFQRYEELKRQRAEIVRESKRDLNESGKRVEKYRELEQEAKDRLEDIPYESLHRGFATALDSASATDSAGDAVAKAVASGLSDAPPLAPDELFAEPAIFPELSPNRPTFEFAGDASYNSGVAIAQGFQDQMEIEGAIAEEEALRNELAGLPDAEQLSSMGTFEGYRIENQFGMKGPMEESVDVQKEILKETKDANRDRRRTTRFVLVNP